MFIAHEMAAKSSAKIPYSAKAKCLRFSLAAVLGSWERMESVISRQCVSVSSLNRKNIAGAY